MSFVNLKKTFRKHYLKIAGAAILTLGAGFYFLTNQPNQKVQRIEKQYEDIIKDHHQKQKEMYAGFIEDLIVKSFFMIDKKAAYAQPIDNTNLDSAKNVKLRDYDPNSPTNELEKMVFLADLNHDGNEDIFYGNFIPASEEFRTTKDCTIKFRNNDGTFGKTIKTTSVAHYLKEEGLIETIATPSIAHYLREVQNLSFE